MKFLFTPHANEEVMNAISYYNEQQKGLGERFVYELQISLGYISSWPNKSQKRYKNVRTASIKKFPFLVFYTINVELQTITILSVFNTYQNPSRIKKYFKNK